MLGRGIAMLALGAALGCTPDAESRAQLLISVDTDLPVVDQITADEGLSFDAAVDTLRIDMIASDGSVRDFLEVVAPSTEDWPVSFGIGADDTPSGTNVRLRLRLFRGQLAVAGELGGRATLEPVARATVDRVIDVAYPAAGVHRLGVVLAAECLGAEARFDPPRTCVDGDRTLHPFSEGISDDDELGPRRVGSWPGAREVACSTAGSAARPCIRGGFSLLGDADLEGFADGLEYGVDPTPMVPVVISPFHMDRTELTVGELRALIAEQPAAIGSERPLGASTLEFCTWTDAPGGNEALPVNCVRQAFALRVCQARGGTLPTEAQWEHAARGRGRHQPYPWGTEAPSCCAASLDRLGPCSIGVEPVASHVDIAGCSASDVSRDGVVDLAGSVAEFTRDALQAYDGPCWTRRGPFIDPFCESSTDQLAVRGASWQKPGWAALASLRLAALPEVRSPTRGFRCVYPDGAP